MNIVGKLEKHIKIKVGGITYVIRRLSPTMFLDKDYVLPITSVLEKGDIEKTGEIEPKAMFDYIERVKDIILLGVVSVNYFLKKQPINSVIDSIMLDAEVYNKLFIAIVNHTLGKKKLKT